jgi:hypothetical protein
MEIGDIETAAILDLLSSSSVSYFARAGVISSAQIAVGRMYIPARKFPVMSHASGVRNQ